LYVNPQGHCYNSARGGGRGRGGIEPRKEILLQLPEGHEVSYTYMQMHLPGLLNMCTQMGYLCFAFNLELTEHKLLENAQLIFLFTFSLHKCICQSYVETYV
jgi:hypothetical protein